MDIFNISETGDFFKVEMRHTLTKTPIKLKPGLPENLPVIQKQIIENIFEGIILWKEQCCGLSARPCMILSGR